MGNKRAVQIVINGGGPVTSTPSLVTDVWDPYLDAGIGHSEEHQSPRTMPLTTPHYQDAFPFNMGRFKNAVTRIPEAQLAPTADAIRRLEIEFKVGWAMGSSSDLEEVQHFIDQSDQAWDWSSTSNAYSKNRHMAMNEIFHLGWDPDELQTQLGLSSKTAERDRLMQQVMKVTLPAEYEATQSYLKSRGLTSVRLYRGMRVQDNRSTLEEQGVQFNRVPQKLPLRARPVSSYSARVTSAKVFAGTKTGIILVNDVPAKNIFSLGGITGAGVYKENEWVVIQAKDPQPVCAVSWQEGTVPTAADIRKGANATLGVKAPTFP